MESPSSPWYQRRASLYTFALVVLASGVWLWHRKLQTPTTFDGLIYALRGHHWSMDRAKALQEFGDRSRDQALTRHLVIALVKGDTSTKYWAQFVVAQHSKGKLHKTLLILRKRDNPTVRQGVVLALSTILIQHHKSWLDTTQATIAKVTKALQEATQDKSPAVKAAAVLAHKRFVTQSTPYIQYLLAKSDDIYAGRRWSNKKWRSLYKAHQTLLVTSMRSPDGRVRGRAAMALHTLGTDALPALRGLLTAQDTSNETRQAVLYVVKHMKKAALPMLPTLQKLLLDPSIQKEALRAIGAMGAAAAPALPTLQKLLMTPGTQVETLRALGQIGPAAKGAVSALLKLWRQTQANGPLQIAAIRAAGKIGGRPEEIVPLLHRVLIRPKLNEKEALAAIEALGRFGPHAAPALHALMLLSSLSTGWYRTPYNKAAVTTIQNIGTPAANAIPLVLGSTGYRSYRRQKINIVKKMGLGVLTVLVQTMQPAEPAPRSAQALAFLRRWGFRWNIHSKVLGMKHIERTQQDVQTSRQWMHLRSPTIQLLDALTQDKYASQEGPWFSYILRKASINSRISHILIRRAGRKGIRHLGKLLRMHKQPSVYARRFQRRVLVALRYSKRKEDALHEVDALLQEKIHPEVQAEALTTFALLAPTHKKLQGLLLRAIQHPHKSLYLCAARIAKQNEGERWGVKSALGRMLKSPQAAKRTQALHALKHMGGLGALDYSGLRGRVPKEPNPQVRVLMLRLISDENAATKSTNKAAQKSIALLLQNLQHKSKEVRLEAIRGLGIFAERVETDGALPAVKKQMRTTQLQLIARLAEPNPQVRRAALKALKHLSRPKKLYIKIMKRALRDKDTQIQTHAAKVLLEYGKDPLVAQLMIARFNNAKHSLKERRSAISTLARLHKNVPKSAPLFAALAKATNAPDLVIRKAAIRALTEYKVDDPRPIPPLLRVLEGKNRECQLLALKSLRWRKKKDANRADLLEGLLTLLRKSQPIAVPKKRRKHRLSLRNRAILSGIGLRGSSSDYDKRHLGEKVRTTTRAALVRYGKLGTGTVPRITRHLASAQRKSLVLDLIEILDNLGRRAEAAAPTLIGKLRHKNVDIASKAFHALQYALPKTQLFSLVMQGAQASHKKVRRASVRAAANLHLEKASQQPQVIALLAHTDSEVQVLALQLLAHATPPAYQARETFARLARFGKTAPVREAAVLALMRLTGSKKGKR